MASLPPPLISLLPGEVEPGWFWAGERGLPGVGMVGAWLRAPCTPSPEPETVRVISR